MDLSSLDTSPLANKGVDIELTHPVTNKPLGVYITVVGQDSQRYRDRLTEDLQRRINKQGAGAIVDELIETAVYCTVGWKEIEWEGKPLEFGEENARMLYQRVRWIHEQVLGAVRDRGNFLPKPSSSA